MTSPPSHVNKRTPIPNVTGDERSDPKFAFNSRFFHNLVFLYFLFIFYLFIYFIFWGTSDILLKR